MQRKERSLNLKVKAPQLNLHHNSERFERPCTSNLVPKCSAPSPAAPPFAVGHTALLSVRRRRERSEHTSHSYVHFIVQELSSYFTDMFAAHLVP